MTSQPKVSPEEPKLVQVLDRDPLTNYLGPYCERMIDSGEPLDSTVTMDTAEPLVSVILSTNSEVGSETTITMTTIKEEPLELENDFEEEFEGQLESNLVKEEPSTSELSPMEANTSHWNLWRLSTELQTNEQCIKFAEDRGLIPTEKLCRYHKKPLHFISKLGYLGVYRCRRIRCRSKRVSRTSGTWFENAKLPITTVFQIMFMFSHKSTYHDVQVYTKEDGVTVSNGTITAWFTQCRETIMVYHLEHPEAAHKIGGPDKIVYIEQSKVEERTIRIRQHIQGQWVVGLMEKGNDDIRLEICPDDIESLKMLIPLIVQKHIEVGTEIRTDSWIAQHCHPQHGFKNKTVTEDGTSEREIPLEPMDSKWRRFKYLLKKKQSQGNFTEWLVEHSWRRNIRISNKCPFEELIKAVHYSF